MGQISIMFGDRAEQARFSEEYQSFLIEWSELQETVKRVMLNRTIEGPDLQALEPLPDDDPRMIAAEDRYKADLSSFVLARTAIDDFSEMLVLASNGFGLGAFKILRGMYERVVTSEYVALYPEVSRALVDSTWTHSWKVWRRAVAMRPEIGGSLQEDEIATMRGRAAEAQARHKESFCKACGQLVQAHAWTKVYLETMAKKVDGRLTELGVDHVRIADYYLRCYLQPTAVEHATGTSVNDKFELLDGHWTYRMDSSREGRQALLFGHALLLILLGYQNRHFEYGLEGLIGPRWAAYRGIWKVPAPVGSRETRE